MSATAQTVIDHQTGDVITESDSKQIGFLDTVKAGLAELEKSYATVPDCSTKEGYEAAKEQRKELAKKRREVDEAHKEEKAEPLRRCQQLDKMKRDILKVITPLEDARKEAIKAFDEKKEREEREAAEKEQRRIDAIQARMSEITALGNAVELDQIAESVEVIEAIDLALFEEFTDQAKALIEDTLASLTERQATLQKQAEEAARIERERQELAEQRAELERQKQELGVAQPERVATQTTESSPVYESVEQKDDAALIGWFESIRPLPEMDSESRKEYAAKLQRTVDYMATILAPIYDSK